ncbi:hypothetical protein RHMOL_Rhmol10G0017600 [Rhododendron molle]|uniref:Uncharacterized protein n=1 Tax=Rhododendron molle TaxID=49168 RepID=A0ACC0LXL9_RHOML|nr:hypothetical protein RHMOL_Rhmol10G0017600 [Rhododendron molle]
MASNSTILVGLLLLSLSSFHFLSVTSFEFQVGGINGWVVPPENNTKIYNAWASKNRFQVGYTIRFRYKKDSVLEVTEAEYKQCNSTRPHFFSNTGNTVFNLDRTGSFYFISGASGHCDRGQRMIVTVMSHDDSSGSKAASLISHGGAAAVAPLALAYICF